MKDPRNTSLTVLYKVIYDRQPLQRALDQGTREEGAFEVLPSDVSRSDEPSGAGGPFVRRLVRGCLE
ncbi:MAG: hypothetical protein IJL98_02370, partial [Lachnospiraceae bacterium]|nr:hypothetical protein [Lachnospiraceae bacterium]